MLRFSAVVVFSFVLICFARAACDWRVPIARKAVVFWCPSCSPGELPTLKDSALNIYAVQARADGGSADANNIQPNEEGLGELAQLLNNDFANFMSNPKNKALAYEVVFYAPGSADGADEHDFNKLFFGGIQSFANRLPKGIRFKAIIGGERGPQLLDSLVAGLKDDTRDVETCACGATLSGFGSRPFARGTSPTDWAKKVFTAIADSTDTSLLESQWRSLNDQILGHYGKEYSTEGLMLSERIAFDGISSAIGQRISPKDHSIENIEKDAVGITRALGIDPGKWSEYEQSVYKFSVNQKKISVNKILGAPRISEVMDLATTNQVTLIPQAGATSKLELTSIFRPGILQPERGDKSDKQFWSEVFSLNQDALIDRRHQSLMTSIDATIFADNDRILRPLYLVESEERLRASKIKYPHISDPVDLAQNYDGLFGLADMSAEELAAHREKYDEMLKEGATKRPRAFAKALFYRTWLEAALLSQGTPSEKRKFADARACELERF